MHEWYERLDFEFVVFSSANFDERFESSLGVSCLQSNHSRCRFQGPRDVCPSRPERVYKVPIGHDVGGVSTEDSFQFLLSEITPSFVIRLNELKRLTNRTSVLASQGKSMKPGKYVQRHIQSLPAAPETCMRMGEMRENDGRRGRGIDRKWMNGRTVKKEAVGRHNGSLILRPGFCCLSALHPYITISTHKATNLGH